MSFWRILKRSLLVLVLAAAGCFACSGLNPAAAQSGTFAEPYRDFGYPYLPEYLNPGAQPGSGTMFRDADRGEYWLRALERSNAQFFDEHMGEPRK
jgi:hypothetical protein